MKISEKKLVAVSYVLTVDGNVVETTTAERPLEFIFGMGFMLPLFEEKLKDMSQGDSFDFKLQPGEAYGEQNNDYIIDLPKDVFMIDGKFDDSVVFVGAELPMSDNQGNRMLGRVLSVEGDVVKMDFNHPMAGKELHFVGKVEKVKEMTDQEIMEAQMAMMGGGGCSCGDSCDCEGGDCGSENCCS